MSDPDRITLMSLVLRSPEWSVTPESLSGPGMDVSAVAEHLEAMAETGLLDRDQGRFSPAPDALARFGAMAGARSTEALPNVAHERSLTQVTTALSADFDGVFSTETVRAFVQDSYRLLASRATVPTFLPVLTSRFARDRLGALARAEGQLPSPTPSVLFVCTRNAARSQIAAAILRSRADEVVRVMTAGTGPAAAIDSRILDHLTARGTPVAHEFPKPLTDEVVRSADVVVTMGCGDACPVIPGKRYVDWPITDPVGLPDDRVAAIINRIEESVMRLLREITAPRSPQTGAG